MRTRHPADRIAMPDRVEVPPELEAEIRSIGVRRSRRGLWWAVAGLVVVMGAVLWWALPVNGPGEVHDSWQFVPPVRGVTEVHDSWMFVAPPAGTVEAHDSWEFVAPMDRTVEVHDSWMNVMEATAVVEVHDSWQTTTP